MTIENFSHKKALILAHYENVKGDCTKFFDASDFSIASLRLQAKPLIKALIKASYRYKVISLNSENPETLDLVGKPDIAIVSKLSTAPENQWNMTMSNLAALARLKSYKVPIATIYSDNRAIEKKYPSGEFHRNLLWHSDLIICPSNKLSHAARLHAHNSKIITIEDPWQIRSEIAFRPIKHQNKIKIIWFGQAANFKYFINIFPEIIAIKSKEVEIELTVLTEYRALAKLNQYKPQILPKNWRLRAVEWNALNQPKQLEDELANAHISLIPSDPNDSRKNGVSHNRVIDSLRAGCIPIASPMDSYKELAECVVLSENFQESLVSVINNYESIRSKIANSRSSITENFSPSENSKKWDQVIKYMDNLRIKA